MKTAEEILKNNLWYTSKSSIINKFNGDVGAEKEVDIWHDILEAMDEYASQFSQSQRKVVTDDIKPDFNFFRTNILRHLSTEDMIALRNWLNNYGNTESKIKEKNCKGCGEIIYPREYCDRCTRQLES